MFTRIFLLFCLTSVLFNCADQDFINPPKSEIEGTWQKSDFWIDGQSIVFEAIFDFNTNHTFQVKANVLHKVNTTYTELNLVGEWSYAATDKVLTLDYTNQENGLIAYYLEVPLAKETYDVHISDGEMSLIFLKDRRKFEMVLAKRK